MEGRASEREREREGGAERLAAETHLPPGRKVILLQDAHAHGASGQGRQGELKGWGARGGRSHLCSHHPIGANTDARWDDAKLHIWCQG